MPAKSPLLAFDENAQLAVVAKAPDGTVLDSATGVASVADGVRLPATLASYWPQVDLANGDQRTVTGGQTMRFLGSVTSGSASIPLTSYDLQVDGASILSTPPANCATSVCGGTQWIDGSWTPPKTAGDHQLVLLASAAGDSRVIRKTYTLTVQAQSAFRIDPQSVVVDPAVGWHLNTLLRRLSDFRADPERPGLGLAKRRRRRDLGQGAGRQHRRVGCVRHGAVPRQERALQALHARSCRHGWRLGVAVHPRRGQRQAHAHHDPVHRGAALRPKAGRRAGGIATRTVTFRVSAPGRHGREPGPAAALGAARPGTPSPGARSGRTVR